MQFSFALSRFLAAALLFAESDIVGVGASTITAAPKSTSSDIAFVDPKTCEARTINYITDSLPQLCLKSSWSVANGTAREKGVNATEGLAGGDITSSAEGTGLQDSVSSTISGEVESSTSTQTSSPVFETEAAATDLDSGELNEASFLSFEEWKKQTLDKAGQGNTNIGSKKSGQGKKRDSESIQNNLDSLGDDGEIDLDFGAFRSGAKGEENTQSTTEGAVDEGQEFKDAEPARKVQRRSDAGKTCKERFSYASFDAGATVLKTHPGAKNSKSVLIENKDSYMLSECSVENKFIIIELSEDIWIDTLVLANYEFFSSMFRTFRVSVSDRWPVKMEKWRDVGTYEARNSRDIQPFLIENPQIWARYIRIEFLSHFGNEYYCPLSLVRVHGTRMLESWNKEAGNDDEVDEIESGEEQYVHEAVAEVVQEEERLSAELKARSALEPEPTMVEVSPSEETPSPESSTTPWEKSVFYLFELDSPLDDICVPQDGPSHTSAAPEVTNTESSFRSESEQASSPISTAPSAHANASEPATPRVTHQDTSTVASMAKEFASASASASNITHSASDTPIISTPTTITPTAKSQNITSSVKNKTSSTSSAASSLPTIQESFFKAVSRRLQLLETNSTLSLKYIEEQSRILRDAFSKVEKKQTQKASTFLETLNSTVLEELRGFRQQYDEIWQSTVISLESQRDESRREILAITTRLNILADEVVFQKRMSIVQSVLLLLCLGLVIFSRVSGGGNIDFPAFYSRRERHLTPYPEQLESPYAEQLDSPLDGSPPRPAFQRTASGHWLETGHRRHLSDETAISRSRSRDDSPPTPISTYSHSEELEPERPLTPPSGADDLFASNNLLEPLEQERPNMSKRSSSYNTGSASETVAPSPARVVRMRRVSLREQIDRPRSETASFESSGPASPPPPPLPPRNRRRSQSIEQEHQELEGDTPVLPPRRSITTDEIGEDGGIEESKPQTSHLPSPPPETIPHTDPEPRSETTASSSPPNLGHSFSIARKPLPSLPAEMGYGPKSLLP